VSGSPTSMNPGVQALLYLDARQGPPHLVRWNHVLPRRIVALLESWIRKVSWSATASFARGMLDDGNRFELPSGGRYWFCNITERLTDFNLSILYTNLEARLRMDSRSIRSFACGQRESREVPTQASAGERNLGGQTGLTLEL
jgi:hypothetical protein